MTSSILNRLKTRKKGNSLIINIPLAIIVKRPKYNTPRLIKQINPRAGTILALC